METNELYVIFLTYVTTKKPIWFHPFPLSQLKVRDYVTIHYTVQYKDMLYLGFIDLNRTVFSNISSLRDAPLMRPFSVSVILKLDHL